MVKTLHFAGNQTGSIETFKDDGRAIDAARIRPVINRRFGLADAVDAYRFIDRAGHFGKVAIDIST